MLHQIVFFDWHSLLVQCQHREIGNSPGKSCHRVLGAVRCRGEFVKLGPRPPQPCWNEHDYHIAEAISLADPVAKIMSGAGDKPLNYLTLQELAEKDDVHAKRFLSCIEGRIPRARSRYVDWAVEQTLCSIVEIYGAAVQIADALMERGTLRENELQAIFVDCPRLSENKWDRHLWQDLRTDLARFEQLNGPLRV